MKRTRSSAPAKKSQLQLHRRRRLWAEQPEESKAEAKQYEDVLLVVAQNLPSFPATVVAANRLHNISKRIRANTPPWHKVRTTHPFEKTVELGRWASCAQIQWRAAVDPKWENLPLTLVGGVAQADRRNVMIKLVDHFDRDIWQSTSLARSAAEGNQMELLQWLHERGCPMDDYVTYYAAANGNLEMLQWALSRGCPWDPEIILRAAEGGHMHIVKFALARHDTLESYVFAAAVQFGDTDNLQWYLDKGCPHDEMACAAAAENGNLPVLKWLRQKGVPWDEVTTVWARYHGHHELYEWAVENGCPVSQQ